MEPRTKVEKWICGIITILLIGCVALVIWVTVSVRLDDSDDKRTCTPPVWGYECKNEKCTKRKIDENFNGNVSEAMGLTRCRQSCGFKTPMDFWPKVTQSMTVGTNEPLWVGLHSSSIVFQENNSNDKQSDFWNVNRKRFNEQIRNKLPKNHIEFRSKDFCDLVVDIDVESDDFQLDQNTDESYSLSGDHWVLKENNFLIRIKAKTIFGARHALETLAQIIIFDEVLNQLMIRTYFEIHDRPMYPHRGISLDTARNYYSVETIKRNIDAMAMVKLNVFHWHITDSQSFPVVIKSHPYLSKFGAYSQDKVYTGDDVADIVKFANNRGIRVIPEFDAPAHVGEGWQFTNLTTCFEEVWHKYCVEPPCGQFDPSKDELYDILEDIYNEMYDMFQKPDMFHMGGDEISFKCWNISESLQKWMIDRGWNLEEEGFMKLWAYFQENALMRLDKITTEKKDIFLWTSTLTREPYLTKYLDKNRYIIQIWTKSTDDDDEIIKLLETGYRVIFSYSDSLYLDCGYEGWVGLGNNWCSPYSGWHKIYSNTLKRYEKYANQILGIEAVLWSEQADEQSLDGRLWPRGIALAEWLWSSPVPSFREAEPRILLQRERFVQNGLRPEALQPQWCTQNEGKCPSD